MSYLERIAACNNADLSELTPFIINGDIYGYISSDIFLQALLGWPEVFLMQEGQLLLNPALESYQTRSNAVADILSTLYQRGIIPTWVGEHNPVSKGYGTEAVLEIERSASAHFGIRNSGVHMNGLVQKSDGVYVWVGTRAVAKPLWPGCYDQIAAGGQPVGIGLRENMLKEAEEEAAIPSEVAQSMQLIGCLHYQQQDEHTMDDSTIYIFDLWLPEDFTPVNTDGEVDQFELMPIEQVADLTEHTVRFKDNCNLVNIDLLLRQGVINASHPDYQTIQKSLNMTRNPS